VAVAHLLGWVLGHAESGWSALGVVALSALIAAVVVAGYMSAKGSKTCCSIIGVLIVVAIGGRGLRHDMTNKPGGGPTTPRERRAAPVVGDPARCCRGNRAPA
jgi:hypothetical protein